MPPAESLLPKCGGYRKLKTFQVAQLVYDLTVLEELKLDYEDSLRQRRLPLWRRDDARRQRLIDLRPATADEVAAWAGSMHQVGQSGLRGQHGPSTPSTPSTSSTYREIAANGALAPIAVATALLDRQVATQAAAFEHEGGFTERLYRVRSANRRKND